MSDAGVDTVESSADRSGVSSVSPSSRSKISNRKAFLADTDRRSGWARRFRDLMSLHLGDLGGDDNVSEAERSIVRRASALEVELERLEARFASADEAKAEDLDLYQRASNTMRRHFEALGLQRRSRDVTPSLSQYVRTPMESGDG